MSKPTKALLLGGSIRRRYQPVVPHRPAEAVAAIIAPHLQESRRPTP